jgi:hypothetical protein
MRAAVSTRKVDYAERLTQRQFSLYDELGRMATLLQNEVAQLGQAQRGLRTEQRSCISVPVTLVGYAIDVLAAMMVQHKAEKGCVPDADVWAALMRAARPVHSGLRDAYMTHDRHEGARRLVDQVAIFCRQSDTPQLLAAVREEGVEGFVVDALLALHEESMRRRKEHMRQHTP